MLSPISLSIKSLVISCADMLKWVTLQSHYDGHLLHAGPLRLVQQPLLYWPFRARSNNNNDQQPQRRPSLHSPLWQKSVLSLVLDFCSQLTVMLLSQFRRPLRLSFVSFSGCHGIFPVLVSMCLSLSSLEETAQGKSSETSFLFSTMEFKSDLEVQFQETICFIN